MILAARSFCRSVRGGSSAMSFILSTSGPQSASESWNWWDKYGSNKATVYRLLSCDSSNLHPVGRQEQSFSVNGDVDEFSLGFPVPCVRHTTPIAPQYRVLRFRGRIHGTLHVGKVEA